MDSREDAMKRYAVTLTRTITQTATFIVEAASADDAWLAAEIAPWEEAAVTSSMDNAPEDGWTHRDTTEIADHRQIDRLRRAAA